MPPQKKRGAQSPPPPVIPDELIFIILSWLPVKSLMRFRCVSKSWKSLISDPRFVKFHLRKSCSDAHFTHHRLISQISGFPQMHATSYSLHNPSSLVEPAIEFNGSSVDVYNLVGSCNGLLCAARVSVKERYWQQFRVSLWNPSTRFRSDDSPGLYVNWVSGPYASPVFGFGYDHISDTYKVVAVFFDMVHPWRSMVKVLSVGDNNWREIQSLTVRLSTRENDGVYLSGSGTLNWVAIRDAPDVWVNGIIDRLLIVSLDLGKETYTQLLLPQGLDERSCFVPTLGALRDCLCVCHDYKRIHCVVWQMKELGDENSWTQLVNISYQDLRTRSLTYRSTMLPLLLYENGDIIMVSLAKSPAALFTWRDNGLESFEIPNNANWTHPKLYVESLVHPC